MTCKPRVGHPVKEGLRLNFCELIATYFAPRVGDPAKEGLRRISSAHHAPLGTPRVGHPAKEGLRLFVFCFVVNDNVRS